MTGEEPTDLAGLFKFYTDRVKPLYSSICADNSMPTEMLFELNAALDHLSRHWAYGETEQDAVEKSFSHLKRCCLDVFKIKARQATEEYEKLRSVDLSIIDNGEFERNLIALYGEIRDKAVEARRFEGDGRNSSDKVAAFARWEPVFELAERMNREFTRSPKVVWAKRKMTRRRIIEIMVGFGVGVISGIIANILYQKVFSGH